MQGSIPPPTPTARVPPQACVCSFSEGFQNEPSQGAHLLFLQDPVTRGSIRRIPRLWGGHLLGHRSLTTLLLSQPHLPASFTQCKLASPPSGGATTHQWMRLGGLLLGLSCLMCVTGSAPEWESRDGHWDRDWVPLVLSFHSPSHSHQSFVSSPSMSLPPALWLFMRYVTNFIFSVALPPLLLCWLHSNSMPTCCSLNMYSVLWLGRHPICKLGP